MKDDDSGSGLPNRDEPTVESGAIDASNPQLLLGDAKIGGELLTRHIVGMSGEPTNNRGLGSVGGVSYDTNICSIRM